MGNELKYNTEEYNRIHKILQSFHENLRQHKGLNEDDADDVTKRLFMFYCLYVPDVRHYNNLIAGPGGGRLSKFEKQRKAAKSAFGKCKSIRIRSVKGEVKECSVCRFPSGNWVNMNPLERDIFVGLIRSSDIGNIINLQEGETSYNLSNGKIWNKLIELAFFALDQAEPTFTVYSGSERTSHTKQLAPILKPLYKFLVIEELSNTSVLGNISTSEYILQLLDIQADSNLLEQYITRNV